MYKITRFTASVVVCMLCMAFTTTDAFSQNCRAQLSVEKDRNTRSASEGDDTSFWVVLTNNSSKTETYSISTVNLKTSCDNQYNRTNEPNVPLSVSMTGNDSRSAFNGSTSLRPGQSYRFRVDVSVPAGTPFNRWSCIEVQAKTPTCTNPATTTLKVLVSDPSEE